MLRSSSHVTALAAFGLAGLCLAAVRAETDLAQVKWVTSTAYVVPK